MDNSVPLMLRFAHVIVRFRVATSMGSSPDDRVPSSVLALCTGDTTYQREGNNGDLHAAKRRGPRYDGVD